MSVALYAAQAEVKAARRAYNATWRKDPTPKGYKAVDKALDRLNAAEAELRRLEAERR